MLYLITYVTQSFTEYSFDISQKNVLESAKLSNDASISNSDYKNKNNDYDNNRIYSDNKVENENENRHENENYSSAQNNNCAQTTSVSGLYQEEEKIDFSTDLNINQNRTSLLNFPLSRTFF